VHRPAISLSTAAVSFLGLIVLGFLALTVPSVRATDAAVLQDFMALDRPRVHDLFDGVTDLVDPLPYALAGLVLCAVALVRGRRWSAVTVAGLLVITGATTQILKHVLVSPRFEVWLGTNQIGDGAWPSGHATAAMTLALCAVLVAPSRLRPTIAVLGGAFALAVGYALIVLAWHYPSDVIGGYLVAGLWTSLALAALALVERSPTPVPAPRSVPAPRLAYFGLGAAAIATGAVVAATLVRDGVLETYVLERPALIIAALAIAALAAALPTALARAA